MNLILTRERERVKNPRNLADVIYGWLHTSMDNHASHVAFVLACSHLTTVLFIIITQVISPRNIWYFSCSVPLEAPNAHLSVWIIIT